VEDGIPRGLQHHHKTYCEKGGCCGRRACIIQRQYHHGDVISKWVGLHMTSDYATEGVLLIECEDRWWRLVAYLSKSLNKMERNYKIHDKEMLVVIRGLETFTRRC